MSRGGSYGGGQSSLGYLFGSHENDKPNASPPPPTLPPYGVDLALDTTPPPPPPKTTTTSSHNPNPINNNYYRAQGQNSGNFITDRPSTRVRSVPGGDSSLGYLFEDKK